MFGRCFGLLCWLGCIDGVMFGVLVFSMMVLVGSFVVILCRWLVCG